LGCGSAGNFVLIETERTCVLVDAGLSGRQIKERLAALGRKIEQLQAVILTHEHGDHTRGLSVICKQTGLPVYANRLTAEAITSHPDWNGKVPVSWRLFATGAAFEIGDLAVESFNVPHDAQDPVNFVIRNESHAVGVLTDLGHATKLVVERVRATDVLIVEANHDVKMLQDDTVRPWATKQRIMSRHGHLSNDAAATLASEVCSDKLRHVFLTHLSRDCNRPELAQRIVADRLGKLGARHVHVAVSDQNIPTATVTL
jgi:phosphoribosyl 1,2-cyclic phosphodiesterase